MTKAKLLTHVEGNGCEALYVDEALFCQGFQITSHQWLKAIIGVEADQFQEKVCDFDWLDTQDEFPVSLSDVQFYEDY